MAQFDPSRFQQTSLFIPCCSTQRVARVARRRSQPDRAEAGGEDATSRVHVPASASAVPSGRLGGGVGRAGDLPIVASRPHTHFIYFPAGKAPRRSVGARSGRLSGRGSASTGAASAIAVGARVSRDGEPRVRTRLGRRSRNPAPRVEEARISDRPGVAVRVGQGAVENEGQLAQRQHG